MTNKLFYGDNLDVLRDSIADESVEHQAREAGRSSAEAMEPVVRLEFFRRDAETGMSHHKGAQGALL